MQAYWTFNYKGALVTQIWTLPTGCLSFQAHLWGATGGSGDGAGGTPNQYHSASWSAAWQAKYGNNTYSSLTHSQIGSNLGGYVNATYNAPITSGAPTWPLAIRVAVGGNGQNGSSYSQGGWPGGGAGGNGAGTPSGNYGGGGGGATALATDTAFSTTSTFLVACGAGGNGGWGPNTPSISPNLTLFQALTPTSNPPWSTDLDASTTLNRIGSTPFTAAKQFWSYNGHALGQSGATTLNTPGVALMADSTNGGSASYGGKATTSAVGVAATYLPAGASTGTGAPQPGMTLATGITTNPFTMGTGGRGGQSFGSTTIYGGGGGGGGYYGGGGGSAATGCGGGGGAGSSYVAAATVGGMPVAAASLIAEAAPPYTTSAGGPSGLGGFALFTARVYPTTPTINSPSTAAAGAMSLTTIGSTAITFSINSAATTSTNGSSAVMKAYKVSYKLGAGSVVTLPTVNLPAPDSQATWNVPAGFFSSVGTYTVFIDTQDIAGDWNTDVSGTLNACASASFTVTTSAPVAAPGVSVGTITSGYIDAEGVSGFGVPVTVTWTAGQNRYQARITLKDAAGNVVRQVTRSITTTGSGSQVFTVAWPSSPGSGYTVTAEVDPDSTLAGLWSTAASTTFSVNPNPPSAPTVVMVGSSATGNILFTITDPVGANAAYYFEVWRSANGGVSQRILTQLYPDPTTHQATWTYQAAASDVTYTFTVRAISVSGGFADATTGTVAVN